MGYVVSLVGHAKTGKTDFAISAPKPLAYMELDIGGFERVNWRIERNHPDWRVVRIKPGISYDPEKDGPYDDNLIIVQDYRPPMQVDTASMNQLKAAVMNKIKNPANFARIKSIGDGQLSGYSDLWYDRFVTEYIIFLEAEEIKTIVFDSATLMWTLCHTTLLEEKQIAKRAQGGMRENLLEIEYGEANKRMEAMIALAREYDKNLVMVHHVTDKYETLTVDGRTQSLPVGERHAGWKHVTKFIDVELWFSVPQISAMDRKNGKKMLPTATITLSGLTLEAQGISLVDGDWDKVFDHIMIIRGELDKVKALAE